MGEDETHPVVSPLYRPALNGTKPTAHEYLSFPLLLSPLEGIARFGKGEEWDFIINCDIKHRIGLG